MFLPEAKGCLQRHSPIFFFCIGPVWQSQNILQLKQPPGINLWFAICSTKSKSQVLQTLGHSSTRNGEIFPKHLEGGCFTISIHFSFSIYTHLGIQWLNPNPPLCCLTFKNESIQGSRHWIILVDLGIDGDNMLLYSFREDGSLSPDHLSSLWKSELEPRNFD